VSVGVVRRDWSGAGEVRWARRPPFARHRVQTAKREGLTRLATADTCAYSARSTAGEEYGGWMVPLGASSPSPQPRPASTKMNKARTHRCGFGPGRCP